MRKTALTTAIVMVVVTGVACSNGSVDGPESSADGTRPAQVEPAEQRDDARVLRELEAVRAALPADPSPPPTTGRYGYSVWRSYSEPGGIRDEVDAIVRAHPDRARSMVIGTSHLGQEIVAVRVSSDLSSAIGERPSVVHLAGQHAREWIGTEIDLRLLRLYLDGTDPDGALARQPAAPTCGSFRSRIPTDTTTASARNRSGGRTCGTTMATARSPMPTAWTSTATCRTSGASTTRGRLRCPAPRRTVARLRRRCRLLHHVMGLTRPPRHHVVSIGEELAIWASGTATRPHSTARSVTSDSNIADPL